MRDTFFIFSARRNLHVCRAGDVARTKLRKEIFGRKILYILEERRVFFARADMRFVDLPRMLNIQFPIALYDAESVYRGETINVTSGILCSRPWRRLDLRTVVAQSKCSYKQYENVETTCHVPRRRGETVRGKKSPFTCRVQ